VCFPHKILPPLLPHFRSPGCDEIITTFWDSKTDLPRHGKAMRWEVGVIKLTAKPASVLANKPQLREKTGNVA
jgi:hypothetical protein